MGVEDRVAETGKGRGRSRSGIARAGYQLTNALRIVPPDPGIIGRCYPGTA